MVLKPQISALKQRTPLKTLGEATPLLIREWDLKKNKQVPEEIPVYSQLKFWWKCSVCSHEWKSSVKTRYYGKAGCPRCAKRRRNEKLKLAPLERSLAFQCPYLMREWHPTKNGDLNAFEIYPHSTTRIWWQCQNLNCRHEWQTSPGHRVRQGSGCPSCARKYRTLGVLSSKALYSWDWARNEQSAFSVHPQSRQEVYWGCVICQTRWVESPASFLQRNVGCWRCENGAKLHQTPRYRKRRSQQLPKRLTIVGEVKQLSKNNGLKR